MPLETFPCRRRRSRSRSAAPSARPCAVALLICLGGAGSTPLGAAEGRIEQTRGVRLLDPGDEMTSISPFPELKPGYLGSTEAPKLDTIRIAVADGKESLLAGLEPRAAPFEIVAASERPDLVWDAASRKASADGRIIAYDVSEADLPAVIDRMAVLRGLAKLEAERPQPMRLASGGQLSRKGDKIAIEIPNVQGRSLILFNIAGDGAVDALYPLGADDRLVRTPAFRWEFQVGAPFGADVVVAVTAAQPMDALEQGLKEISHYRSAGEILKLIAIAAPADARIGAVRLSSAP